MLLFRSEEHVDRWLAERHIERGQTMSVDQQWTLARVWYGNRLEPGWRRRTSEEAHAVFAEVGLTDPFWRLTP